MSEIVILGAARTPMGGLMGALSTVPAPELGAVAIKAALERAGVASSEVTEVLMGSVLPAGVGQAPARQAALKAGLDKSVPCTTLNKVCGSGMKTVMVGVQSLLAGAEGVVVAGGMESMSLAPHMLTKARSGYRLGHGELLDHMYTDGLVDAYSGGVMGNFAELTADKYGFTREMQDDYAIESLRRANAAINEGVSAAEIAPVTIASRKGELVVDVDEQPGNARPDKIPQLRPVFKKDGTVTAANASSISDGAAALAIASAEYAASKGHTPIAVIKGFTQAAHEPEWFTTAPVPAMQKLLERTGWSVEDVDLFEVNEAFAVVAMAAMKELNIPHDKVNVLGGACAVGHPLGCTGARIIVTLINALKQRGGKRGIASLCIGGGEATAIAIELV